MSIAVRSGFLSSLAAVCCVSGFCSPANAVQRNEPEARVGWTTSRLQGTPTRPDPFRVVPAFPGLKFDHPTSLIELPGAGRLVVSQMDGKVFSFREDSATDIADLAVDLAAAAGGNVSLFSVMPHPQFATNGEIFACLVHPGGDGIDGSHTRVSRFRATSTSPLKIDPSSENVVITWPSGGHNAGCLRFGPDGLLYIATGDGSGPNPPDGFTTGQTVDDLLGAILRIDVDHPAEGLNYAIPKDNPFANRPDSRGEIFGYGLRNPWKFDIDARNGDVFVADNGWETWEMVHLVRSGTNCGWPVMEGRAALRSEVAIGPTPISPPIRDHHHSEANSVIGGPVYRGTAHTELTGHFIYGDYITGTIWSTSREQNGSFTGQTLADTDLRIVDFTQNTKGTVYVLDYDLTGQVYQLQKNDVQDLSEKFPRRLSETGLLEPGTALRPAAGVVPYTVTVPRWSDGAMAERWLAVPGTEQVELSSRGSVGSKFPAGTALVKHLSIPATEERPARRLETQVLLYWNGVWNPFSYLWRPDGTDADLVSPAGTATMVQWPDVEAADGFSERTWRTGAINECRLCHNSGPGFVLGFNAEQLSGGRFAAVNTSDEATDKVDRLKSLITAGHVAMAEVSGDQYSVVLVDPADQSLDLNDRARSYLHGNCGMCHHRGGNAIVSFYLTADLPYDQLNTNKGTNIGTFGLRDAKIIVPGEPHRSVLMYRMSKLGYARMPYIGSHVVDSAGVALIDEWIRSLPGTGPGRAAAPVTPESGLSELLETLATGASPATRSAALSMLMGSTEGALALATRFHAGQYDPADRHAATEIARNASSDIRGLFDHFLPESARKKTLGSGFEAQSVLTVKGDALRGRLIFFSDAARCRTCHQLDDAALSVGPTLTEISKKYTHDSELLQHVVSPSLKIDDKFAAWIAALKDGRVVSGLLQSESSAEIVLRTTDARSIMIPRAEIEELQKSSRSLMPDNVLADLTAQEAADLLAFIRAVAK